MADGTGVGRACRCGSRWFGKAGDAGKFARAAADHMGGEKGDILHFRLAHTIVRRGGGNESPKEVDWARVQRGFALPARYEETRRNDNEFAMLAYLVEDKAVAQKQFALRGDDWSRGAWPGQEVP